jgi:hypothetical protein
VRCRVQHIAVAVVVLVAAGGRWFGFLVVVASSWRVGCARRVGRFSVCGARRGWLASVLMSTGLPLERRGRAERAARRRRASLGA